MKYFIGVEKQMENQLIKKISNGNKRSRKKKGMDGKACWKGYELRGTKMKGGKRVDNCVKIGKKKKKK